MKIITSLASGAILQRNRALLGGREGRELAICISMKISNRPLKMQTWKLRWGQKRNRDLRFIYMRLRKGTAWGKKIIEKQNLEKCLLLGKRNSFKKMVQGGREKCLMLGIFHLPLQLTSHLPHSTLWLWLVHPMGDPNKGFRAWAGNRGRTFFPGSQCTASPQSHKLGLALYGRPQPSAELSLQVPVTAASPCLFRPADGNGSLLLLAPK